MFEPHLTVELYFKVLIGCSHNNRLYVMVVVVVVGRSWQATNVPQPAGLLYRYVMVHLLHLYIGVSVHYMCTGLFTRS
jgi:hypothetical protein